MSLINVAQGSPEWLEMRVGQCTGSRIKDVMDFLKNGKPSAERKKYLIDTVSEILTGYAVDHYVTPAMEHGLVTEKYARAAYEVKTGNSVERVGIAVHPTITRFMASPDGLIGEDGVWEGKCPTTGKHIQWMLEGVVPEEHRDQCYAEIACSEREWCDFTSFDDRLPLRHQLFVARLPRDDKRIAEIEYGVKVFLAEVFELLVKLETLNPEILAVKPKVQEIDPALGITDADMPAWYKKMQEETA